MTSFAHIPQPQYGHASFIVLRCLDNGDKHRAAGALAGLSVHAVVGSATDAPADETVTCFHTIFHATARINEAESEELADSRRITPDYAGYSRIGKMVSVLVSVADPKPLNSLLHTQLELEAEGRNRSPQASFRLKK